MTEKNQRETAKIIQFPVEPRAARAGAQPGVRGAVDRPAIATVDFGSGWYHDAAIEDAGLARHR